MKKLQAHFYALSPEQFSVAVPVLPESQDAATRYKDIFRFINDHLRAHWAVLGEEGDRRLWQLAYLTVDWMRGRPLAYLISTREKISARHQNPPNTATIIRSVMSDVEVYARFNIPRYLRCYLDIQVDVAKKRQLDSLIENLPDLELWLELGVSVRSALSLMELGLSRTSAIELVDHMTATEFNKEQVLAWLRANAESQAAAEWYAARGIEPDYPATNFLWFNSAVKPASVEKLAPYHYFADQDIVTWRSGWDEEATCYHFRCGPPSGTARRRSSKRSPTGPSTAATFTPTSARS